MPKITVAVWIMIGVIAGISGLSLSIVAAISTKFVQIFTENDSILSLIFIGVLVLLFSFVVELLVLKKVWQKNRKYIKYYIISDSVIVNVLFIAVFMGIFELSFYVVELLSWKFAELHISNEIHYFLILVMLSTSMKYPNFIYHGLLEFGPFKGEPDRA